MKPPAGNPRKQLSAQNFREFCWHAFKYKAGPRYAREAVRIMRETLANDWHWDITLTKFMRVYLIYKEFRPADS